MKVRLKQKRDSRYMERIFPMLTTNEQVSVNTLTAGYKME